MNGVNLEWGVIINTFYHSYFNFSYFIISTFFSFLFFFIDIYLNTKHSFLKLHAEKFRFNCKRTIWTLFLSYLFQRIFFFSKIHCLIGCFIAHVVDVCEQTNFAWQSVNCGLLQIATKFINAFRGVGHIVKKKLIANWIQCVPHFFLRHFSRGPSFEEP